MYTERYATDEPTRATVDAIRGAAVVEFGAPWCGHCIAAQPLVKSALSRHPCVEHLRIEDGRGRALGRSYRVKLWPTLVFLRDGVEQGRLVRPDAVEAIDEALERIDPPSEAPGEAAPR